MDKRVIDISGANKICKETEINIGGQPVTVRDHLSVEERVNMAQDIINMTTIIDDETEIIMTSYMIDIAYTYAVMKYYTDVDTDNLEPADVFDWVLNNGSMEALMDIVANDLAYVFAIADQMMENVIAVYDKQHSLGTAFRKSFGFLFNGEDITETLMKSQGLGEQMIDTLDKLQEANKKPAEGKLNVGGNVLSFAKKKTK